MRYSKHYRMGFLLIMIALCLGGCAAMDAYNKANVAFENGDYQTSFINYLYAANQYIVPAQYAVGYQYYYGLGTKRDETSAIRWFEKAAPRSERATYALHLIQESKPDMPWLFQLKKPVPSRTKTTYYSANNRACVINVKCTH